MNRICHVTSVHDSIDNRIFAKECRSLTKISDEVFLVAPGDSFKKDGVSVVGVQPDKTSRLYRIFKFSKKVVKSALELDAQIYHLHDPELLPYVNMLRKAGKIVIYDAHEDLPAQIQLKQWIPAFLRGTIAHCMKKYQERVLKRVNAVVTVNQQIREKLLKSNSNITIVTNYPIIQDGDLDSEYSYEKTICFVGGISPNAQHIDLLQSLVGCPGVKYILCGSGSKDYMDSLHNCEGSDQVDFKGFLPYDEVKKTLTKAGMGMAILPYNDADGGKMGTIGNTKLFEYMLAGIPVVCTDFITWKEIIDKEECGITVNPYDQKEISNAINYLVQNPEVACTMGKKGREAIAKKYNWSIEEEKLLNLYKTLLCEEK